VSRVSNSASGTGVSSLVGWSVPVRVGFHQYVCMPIRSIDGLRGKNTHSAHLALHCTRRHVNSNAPHLNGPGGMVSPVMGRTPTLG
jgi:hypothetical protein